MKKHLNQHKYLHRSALFFIAILVMVGFISDGVANFVNNLGRVLALAAFVCIGLYLLQMFSGWILWFVMPKPGDSKSDKKRDSYSEHEKESINWLWLYIYTIVAAVIVFGEMYNR